MEDRVDAVATQHSLTLPLVADVHQLRSDCDGETLASNGFLKLDVDGVERVLGLFGKNDEVGLLAENLAAELASDRAARAGDEHPPPRDVALHEFGVRCDFVAA